MRVRGDNAPSNAFSLEEQPNKPGVALVRFYENAEPFEEKRDELTISGWVYDEYHLELNMYDGLSEDILGNYAGYLAQAKLHEAEGKTIPSLQQQVADLETDKAALTEKVTSLEGQVTDTQMAKAGINKTILGKLGGEVHCFMSDPDVAETAKKNGTTRAVASMEKATKLDKPLIFAIGNAPTALIQLYEMIREGRIRPELIIGVPVGFVNVVQAKELIMTADVPYIVAKGRKGGSNIAAAICNALLYMLDSSRGQH